MRALSRALSLLIVILVLVAFVRFVAPRIQQRISQLEDYLPQILAAELTQYLGRDVTIRQLSIDKSNHLIDFRGVTIARTANETGPPPATIDRIIVRYDPRFLTLNLFKPLNAIQD